MNFLAQVQGFAFALMFCLVGLLAFAAGVRASGRQNHSSQSDLEIENDRLVHALCEVASSVETIAIRGATGPVRKVYVLAVTALGLPNKAPPLLEPGAVVPLPNRLSRGHAKRAGSWGRA
jgi:hypothetical protein